MSHAPLFLKPYESRFERDCARLIAALSEWFGIPEANARYLRDLGRHPSWVAMRGSDVVGAATLVTHDTGALEIHFLAVHPACHRQGIGRRLVAELEAEARRRGGRWLHVKTLAPSHPDPYYDRTRVFYSALGFLALFETEDVWGPENPAIVLAKPL